MRELTDEDRLETLKGQASMKEWKRKWKDINKAYDEKEKMEAQVKETKPYRGIKNNKNG